MFNGLGLATTTTSIDAVLSLDRAIESVCKFRRDAAGHIAHALLADPEFVLAQVVRGYIMLGAFKRANYQPAAAALPAALARRGSLSGREQLHVDAWKLWAEGNLPGALLCWDQILGGDPTDLIAVRMIDLNSFWGGNPTEVRRNAARAELAWRPGMPGHDIVLAIAALADEEAGQFASAERKSRRALEIDPANFFAAHALSHVFEMQGRTAEATRWFESLEPVIGSANNMRFHLSWHQALVLLESAASDAELLAFYDSQVRDLQSPLIQALPDLYIDLMNATSLLWRFERSGIDVGPRWQEQADRAEARVGDATNLLGVAHYVLALIGAGRTTTADAMIGALEAATGDPTVRDVALPVCRAIRAYGQRDFRKVVAELFPVLGEIARLGGSKAQHDLFTQMVLDAATRAGDGAVVSAVGMRERSARPAPIEGRRAYRAVAARTAVQ